MSAKSSSQRRIVRRQRSPVIDATPRVIVRRRGPGVAPPPASDEGFSLPHPGGRLLLVLTLLGLLAMVIGGGAWLFRSPYFRITTVEVAGTVLIPPESIAERASLYDQSMFTADLGAVQEAVARHPLVSTVHVERRWPHTVRITVQERKAWGTWEQGGVSYTIDREGVVLGTLPVYPNAPVIRSSEPGSRQLGDRVDYQAVEAAAEIYERLPKVLGTPVEEVSYEAGKGLVVTTAGGQRAYFGDSSSIAYKLAVWSALAEAADERHISYTTIDLRYGNRPVLQ